MRLSGSQASSWKLDCGTTIRFARLLKCLQPATASPHRHWQHPECSIADAWKVTAGAGGNQPIQEDMTDRRGVSWAQTRIYCMLSTRKISCELTVSVRSFRWQLMGMIQRKSCRTGLTYCDAGIDILWCRDSAQVGRDGIDILWCSLLSSAWQLILVPAGRLAGPDFVQTDQSQQDRQSRPVQSYMCARTCTLESLASSNKCNIKSTGNVKLFSHLTSTSI